MIENCDGDQKLLSIIDTLLGRGKPKELPSKQNPRSLAEAFNDFFITKITKIRSTLEELEATTANLSLDLQAEMTHIYHQI